jgi:hypothetical protein
VNNDKGNKGNPQKKRNHKHNTAYKIEQHVLRICLKTQFGKQLFFYINGI